ncbi:MAG: acetyl-CoA carboxylase biotin carboxylase subunit [Bacilli bacterium]|nr:acetyl-CoA carboxylase biotin carboxylase subunit [Bacilli bacterium]
MQNKVLVANRGEIALRIIRACKELGISTVAVYSTADKDSLHVKFADEAICIGSEKSANSYLNINNIISAAIATGCNAIHPGYGFLSENEKFAEIVEKCNIKFIGPSSKVIEQCGNKANARKIAQACGVPVVKGSDGIVSNLGEALTIAQEVGYPILIKAVNGGGGKGISIVKNEEELKRTFERTMLEAYANFGDRSVYIEKLIENPRHIEIQILADSYGNVIHLGERDCSIQRRNQKIIEETPSPFVSEELREKMGQAAIKIAKYLGYVNAGTVEFIVDREGNYYFIEINTRIQVEHPITEMVTGVDLVKEQIKIAYGHELSYKQENIHFTGHALECRINAEDVDNNFAPSPGKINNLVLPGGFGVRIDSHLYSNYVVPPYYDSLLAKLIVHGQNRKEAIRKMRIALEQFVIEGIKTNIEFQYLIMHNPDFVRGSYDTSFIKRFIELVRSEA